MSKKISLSAERGGSLDLEWALFSSLYFP